jgi:hypothetical protein
VTTDSVSGSPGFTSTRVAVSRLVAPRTATSPIAVEPLP